MDHFAQLRDMDCETDPAKSPADCPCYRDQLAYSFLQDNDEGTERNV